MDEKEEFLEKISDVLNNYFEVGSRSPKKLKEFTEYIVKSKKNSTDYLHFEDKSFPSYIKKIKGRYFYKDKKNKRKYSQSII